MGNSGGGGTGHHRKQRCFDDVSIRRLGQVIVSAEFTAETAVAMLQPVRTTTRLLARFGQAVTTSRPLPSSKRRSTTAKAGGLSEAASLPSRTVLAVTGSNRVQRARRRSAKRYHRRQSAGCDPHRLGVLLLLSTHGNSRRHSVFSWFSAPRAGFSAQKLTFTAKLWVPPATDAPPLRRFVSLRWPRVFEQGSCDEDTEAHTALFPAAAGRFAQCAGPPHKVPPPPQSGIKPRSIIMD